MEENGEAGVPTLAAIEPNDLTHDEKLRCIALSMACKYYLDNIVRDGELYREMTRNNVVLKPACVDGLLEAAWSFEMFISGKLSQSPAELAAGDPVAKQPKASTHPKKK